MEWPTQPSRRTALHEPAGWRGFGALLTRAPNGCGPGPPEPGDFVAVPAVMFSGGADDPKEVACSRRVHRCLCAEAAAGDACDSDIAIPNISASSPSPLMSDRSAGTDAPDAL